MKIICDKDEFASLVRLCAYCETEHGCNGCVIGSIFQDEDCPGIEAFIEIEE